MCMAWCSGYDDESRQLAVINVPCMLRRQCLKYKSKSKMVGVVSTSEDWSFVIEKYINNLNSVIITGDLMIVA